MEVFQSAAGIKDLHDEGIVGMRSRVSANDISATGINALGLLPVTYTLTVTGLVDGDEYTVPVLNGQGLEIASVTFTAEATDDESAEALKVALDGNPNVRGRLVPSVAANVVTCTGRPGSEGQELFDFGALPAGITKVKTQAAKKSDVIRYGRLLVIKLDGSTQDLSQTPIVGLPTAANLPVNSVAYDLTYGAGGTVLWSLTVDATGDSYSGSVPMDTDADTTAANVAASMVASLPADLLTPSSDAEEVKVEGAVPLASFSLSMTTAGGGSVALSDSSMFGVEDFVAGISQRRAFDREALSLDSEDVGYASTDSVEYNIFTTMWVEWDPSQAPASSLFQVWCSVDPADAGKLYGQAGPNRFPLPKSMCKVTRRGKVNQKIAEVAIDFPNR